MQGLIIIGIVAIIVIAVELSVIAYFAVIFFRQAFTVAQKAEKIEDDIQDTIKDTSDRVHRALGFSINKIIKMVGTFLSVKTKTKRKK